MFDPRYASVGVVLYTFVQSFNFKLTFVVISLTHSCQLLSLSPFPPSLPQVEQEKRELEARLGATPPPSPSDKNSPAFLNTRITQLSNEVEKLRKLLSETRAQSKPYKMEQSLLRKDTVFCYMKMCPL